MSMLVSARVYQAQNWSVIPTRHDKRPAVEWRAYQYRKATEQEIAQWWGDFPGVGIVCGRISGLAVLDIDPRNGGQESFRTLLSEGRAFPKSLTVDTGGGGIHIYYSLPAGASIPTRPGFRPGLDLKAEGGYVVAPPSPHPSGRQYHWRPGRGIGEIPLAPCPAWLMAGPGAADRKPSLQVPEKIVEQTRNDTLFRLASSLRAKGLIEPEIMSALVATNNSRCSPPLSYHELMVIAGSAGKYEGPTVAQKRSYGYKGLPI